MKKNKMALKVNGTPVYIGEEYETAIEKLKKALKIADFKKELIEYKKDREKDIMLIKLGETTNAYFNINNKLVGIVTDKNTFTGYCGARGHLKFDFKDEDSRIEKLPKIFSRCSENTKISYCGKMRCWFETTQTAAVFSDRKKNRPECEAKGHNCSCCNFCETKETHIMSGIDKKYDIMTAQINNDITVFGVSAAGILKYNKIIR